jgi:hypothetical protein
MILGYTFITLVLVGIFYAGYKLGRWVQRELI